MNALNRNCAGVARRDFIQLGVGGVLGLGMGDLVRLRADTARAVGKASPDDVNCILVWLDGGPTHYETFDPKPDAPSGVRGEFKPIPTTVPGVSFCETMPKLAKTLNRMAIIRSICHKDPNHGGGNHYMMTGAPTPVPVNCGSSVSFHPSFGSTVSHLRGIRDGLPAYATLPRKSRSAGPHFLGGQHAPFVIDGDPNRKGYRVRDVVLPRSISEGRADTRLKLRRSLDRMLRIADAAAADPAVEFDSFYQQGIDLISSPKAQAAFDVEQEPAAVRDRYGRNDFGQRLLLARRLAGVGVSFVTVYNGGWDHHTNIFKEPFRKKVERVDTGMAALINDLHDRGQLDSTLVLLLGEFGRTPKINKDVGRDHWPHAMSVLVAGAGVPPGQVIGSTDVKGYYASDRIYSPEDFACSLYTKMGIDPHKILYTNTGRPFSIVNGGAPIKELFG
ncbi:MAG: hypothetical protein CMO43_06690 [Verrucomicrobiales bacterium]|jgi:hypothetical protein|nr:hypothetical protein [Verrucomicrobiales bacterium]MDP6752935.1 DUF1501 domain-containing protein [Verrucomicrobiota bacterium]MDP7013634.1 DUF1501 domain-containing protein [Verrucomicrobiota bacterium]